MHTSSANHLTTALLYLLINFQLSAVERTCRRQWVMNVDRDYFMRYVIMDVAFFQGHIAAGHHSTVAICSHVKKHE